MLRFLIQFWPVFVPLFVYLAWQFGKRRHARKNDAPVPGWREGPWFWTVIACMAAAAGCFIFWGLQNEKVQGTYVPPHLENGRVVPGHVEK